MMLVFFFFFVFRLFSKYSASSQNMAHGRKKVWENEMWPWECKYALWPRFLSLFLVFSKTLCGKTKSAIIQCYQEKTAVQLMLVSVFFQSESENIYCEKEKTLVQVPLARKSATHREAQLEHVLEFKIQRAPHYNFSWHFISLWQNPESTAS